jgi:hypothetical protein
MGKKGRPTPVTLEKPVLLELSGSLNRQEVLRYFFASHKQSQAGTAKPEIKQENVDFEVQTTTKEVFPGGEVSYLVQTLNRKGDVPLHDLAFPEPGERLEQIMTRSGRVLKAGEYPPESIFFLPPIPLPIDAVSVGDTWSLRHRWASDSSGLPLELDLVAIFKSVYACGEGDECADLEISGQVSLPQKVPGLQLESQIEGHMLFAIKYGSVVWSEIRTSEKVIADQTTATIHSCLKSHIKNPENYKWKWDTEIQCDPTTGYQGAVPGVGPES